MEAETPMESPYGRESQRNGEDLRSKQSFYVFLLVAWHLARGTTLKDKYPAIFDIAVNKGATIATASTELKQELFGM